MSRAHRRSRKRFYLDAFAAGKTLPQYLGKTYHEVFEKCRREECDRFRSEVSERDYEWYLRAV